MSARLLIGVLILAVLLAGAYGAYWHYVASRLQAGIAEWVEVQRSLGSEIAFANDPIGGFPLAFRTTFRNVALGFPQQDGPTITVTGSAVAARVLPWNLRDIRIDWAAPVTVTGPAGAYAAGKGQAVVTLPAAAPADYHQPLLPFDIDLQDITLPPPQRAVADGPIARLAATGAIMGPVPPFVTLHDALTGWANAGGTIELKSFTFDQAPLSVTGSGTVALDEMLQPLGALAIAAQGLPETIALLEQQGMIDAQAAKTGSLMAKGLAKPDAAGRPTVTVSLSLQQGYLWLGPVKLARLPAVSW